MKIIIYIGVFLVLETSFSKGQGDYWTSWGSLPGAITSLAAGTQGNVFAIVNGRGVFRSNRDFAGWVQVNNGLPDSTVGSLAIAPSGDLYVVAATHTTDGSAFDGIFRSTDQGEAWSRCNDPNMYNLKYASLLAINPLTSSLFVSNGTFIFRSTDKGSTWTDIFLAFVPYGIQAMYFSMTGNGYLQVFNHGASYIWYNVWVIADSGQSYELSYSADRFAPPISTIAQSQRYLLIGTGGGGIYRCSRDSCTYNVTRGYPVFTAVDSGLSSLYLTSIVVDSVDHVFVGTKDRGVYRSEDEGASWTQLNGGLLDSSISCIAVTPENYLFVATASGQLFRSNGRTTSVKLSAIDGPPEGYSLAQNYPNPFNPRTTIRFDLPNSSNVKLTVFDILGCEVSVLVNERRDAGVYEVKFDGSNLSSGVYFYRLQAGDFTQSKRFLLLK
jgi:photosystem II stability/assembly factor-like uncharacterized protein